MATITKRKNSYLIRVSCGYNDQGHQIVKSKTWKPAPGMTERQIQKELNKVSVEFENNVMNGNIADTTRIRMDQFCKDYLELSKNSLSPVTQSYYKRIMDQWVIPQLGHMKVKDIKPIHIQRFIQTLEKPTAGKNGKPLAPGSVHRYFVVIKSIMARAYKLGYTDINPTDTSRLDLPIIEEPEIKVFTKEETANLLECLKSEPLQYQILIHLAIVTGCRRGELVALQWNCIDFEKGSISVKQSNYKLKGEEIKTKTTKTKGSIRNVAIPQYCVNMLRTYKSKQSAERLTLGEIWNDGGWIFTQWNGEPMHPDTPTRWFKKFQERHGIPHRHFHALRHTSATLLLSDGTNIKTVAARLGHTQLQTTNRYVHSLTSAEEAAAMSFENLVTNHNSQEKKA